jgi:tripartite-type tricarboxylate transporter receptor subunit TctC
MNRFHAILGALFCALSVAIAPAQAQTFPSKRITILIAFTTGQPEIQIRFLAQHLEKRWGQPVTIEPRPGAAQLVAAEAVAKAPPDGYTLFFTTAGLASLKVFIKDMTFDVQRDVAPVSTLVDLMGGLVTNSNVPAKNVDEFIAYVKANPGKFNYASAGPNTTLLIIEQFKRLAGIQLTEVPYKGAAPAVTALLANDVQLMQATFDYELRGRVDAGTVRPLLMVGPRRSRLFPDVPAAAERGWNIPRNGWTGVVAPAATPRDIVNRISEEINVYVKTPEALKRAAENAIEMTGSTPEQMRQLIESDSRTWADIANSIGLKPQ